MLIQLIGMLECRIPIVATSYLSQVFVDSDTSTHSDMWESLLVFTKAFPSSWSEPTLKKPIVQRMYTFLDSAAYGSILVSYPTLLPLLSVLPSDILQSENFPKRFLSHFWNGLKNGIIDRTNGGVFFSSFLECILYFLIKNRYDFACNMGLLHLCVQHVLLHW